MRKIIYLLLCTGIAFLLPLGGCKKEAHPPPPLEASSLLLRLFENMEKKKAEQAAEQALKMQTLLPGNPYIGQIVDTQRTNNFILIAEQELGRGDLGAATRRVTEGARRYPLNRTLQETRHEVDSLLKIQEASASIRAARRPEELEAGLKKLQKAILPLPPKARLHKTLEIGYRRLHDWRNNDPAWRLRTTSIPPLHTNGLGAALYKTLVRLDIPEKPGL